MALLALTNVARHAQATHVDIELNSTHGTCMVRIADNGRGMPDEGARKPQSFGLLGIRERVGLLGGKLVMDSSPGGGVTMSATIPLETVTATTAERTADG